MEPAPAETGLGNLAQAARTNQLKSARGILLFVGILTAALNIGLCVFADKVVDSQIDKEVADLQAQGMQIDNVALTEFREGAIRSFQLVNGIAVLLGVVFIVCGIMVYKYPVPATILSLVLYIGAAAVYGVLDPTTLASGWIIKIFIVIALFKAVQAALAYEKENKQSEAATPQLAAI
jgi:hypothetical protein